MQGKVQGDTFIVIDSFALPVEGTETRVNAQVSLGGRAGRPARGVEGLTPGPRPRPRPPSAEAPPAAATRQTVAACAATDPTARARRLSPRHQAEAYEYMVDFMDSSKQVGRPENVVGWYHSHPGYGCWLSGEAAVERFSACAGGGGAGALATRERGWPLVPTKRARCCAERRVRASSLTAAGNHSATGSSTLQALTAPPRCSTSSSRSPSWQSWWTRCAPWPAARWRLARSGGWPARDAPQGKRSSVRQRLPRARCWSLHNRHRSLAS
jgi:hypothetical protein